MSAYCPSCKLAIKFSLEAAIFMFEILVCPSVVVITTCSVWQFYHIGIQKTNLCSSSDPTFRTLCFWSHAFFIGWHRSFWRCWLSRRQCGVFPFPRWCGWKRCIWKVKTKPVWNCSWPHEGYHLYYCAYGDNIVHIDQISHWTLSFSGFSFSEVSSIRESNSKVVCCHFSTDGKYLASGGHDKKACIIIQKLIRMTSGHLLQKAYKSRENFVFLASIYELSSAKSIPGSGNFWNIVNVIWTLHGGRYAWMLFIVCERTCHLYQ